jgi:hypothetical protein
LRVADTIVTAYEAQQRRKALEPKPRDWPTVRAAVIAARLTCHRCGANAETLWNGGCENCQHYDERGE